MCQTLKALIETSAKKNGNCRAVVIPEVDKSISYNELEAQVTALQQFFILHGLNEGEITAIVLPNGLEFLIAFLSVTNSRG
jgi:acyl-CoA synthetase (AMP-forming)/AMP-acid ligase II